MKKEEITLTEKQKKVLNAIYEQAIDATGGDFGIVDEVMENMKRSKMRRYQIGAIISTLVEKKLIVVHPKRRVNNEGKPIRQITFKKKDIEKIIKK